MPTATFAIEGMSCAACVGRVERTLKAVPGVTGAQANLVAATALVEFDTPADAPAMAEALRRAGYPPSEIETRLDVEGMTCASCVGRVERTLKAAPGVTLAEVNLATRSARVRYYQGLTDPATLAARVTGAGYEATPHRDHATKPQDRQAGETGALARRAVVSAILTIPVVVLAMGAHAIPTFHHWIMGTLGLQTSWLIQFVLTALVLFGPGRPFLSHGVPALMRGAPEMNSLVALGSLAAFAYSSVATFAPSLLPETARDVYFEAAATIVTLILVGRMLEARAKGRAGEAIRRLVGLRPDTARVERDGDVAEVAVEALHPGDVVRLAPGERVAVDGVVVEGHGWIDESMLTGEPAPVEKAEGAGVTGGTVNGAAALTYRVTATGADTVLSRIIRLVEEAQAGKLPVQALVDRITFWFVPAVMATSLLTFVLWLALGPAPALSHALVAAIAVLIIACPCAMGLATPVSILVGTGRGAERGVLFRRGDALQRLSEVGIVAFDKTGTLTEGHPKLTEIEPAEGVNADDVLRLAASAEVRSEHPLARAIVAAAAARGLALVDASGVEARPGRGLAARVAGHDILIGNARALGEAGIECESLAGRGIALAEQGRTPILVAIDGRAAALLAVADPIKPGAAEAIAALHRAGLKTAMISGDTQATARAVAGRLGIDEVRAEVLPEGKVAALRDIAGSGPVAFVGDGINDAPALAAADVGIAMGTGTDVAIESAEVVLMGGDPGAVATAITLSRATMRNIRQNLFWAFGYNVVLIPVAAGLMFPLGGPLLSPMLAAGAMALSSVFVVTNALRLRRA